MCLSTVVPSCLKQLSSGLSGLPELQEWVGSPAIYSVPTGSGQQSVTGVEASDDANSYWRVRGKVDGSCQRGTPVKCGQAIRLTHVNTGKNLHTHHFPSPLSNNQVSCSES